VVYNVKDKDIPIVHRVVRKFGAGYVKQCISKTRNKEQS
jgi:signal peptidase